MEAQDSAFADGTDEIPGKGRITALRSQAAYLMSRGIVPRRNILSWRRCAGYWIP